MLTLILGGARSGKSRYAESLCRDDEKVFYLATAPRDLSDAEMDARILRHKNDRPARWTTIEEPLDIAARIAETPTNAVILLDCATIWLSNLMWENRALEFAELERTIFARVGELTDVCKSRKVIAVSNEVGGGVVPDNQLARQFRDLQGFVNQKLAQNAERVILVVAGLPLTLKG